MEKEFVQYEEAFKLKEIGFDEPCIAFYDAYNGDSHLFFKLRANPDWLIKLINVLINKKERSVIETSQYHLEYLEGDNAILTPTYSQAFRWFRDEHGLKHDIDDHIGTKFYYRIKSFTDKFDNYDDIIKPMREEKDPNNIEFNTYEEAELACLKKLIEIIKR
jgi:hypothetical protein